MRNQSFDFGPWTTALDSSSRMQLSTFWKQRMSRLAELSRSMKMSRLTITAALALAVVISISPLVELVPAAPSEKAPIGDFVARFSNGVTVELIGLGENPSVNAEWWTPDGVPLKKRPYHNVMAHMSSPNSLAREVCWRWRGISGTDVQTNWSIEPSYNGAGGGRPVDQKGNPIDGLTAWAISLDGSPDTCTIKLSMSVPATPWETQIESQAGHTSSTGFAMKDGRRGAVSYLRSRVDGSDTVVTVGYQIAGEVRLSALDYQGTQHLGVMSGGSGVSGFMMRDVRFKNIKPENLKTWQLQTRQRKSETVEFRNVSLHKGKVTDVETVMQKPKLLQPDADPSNEEYSRLEVNKVIERTLDIHKKTSLDLDTGKLVTVPQVFTSSDEAYQWFSRNGVDVAGMIELGFQGLTGFDLVAFPLSEEFWDVPLELLTRVDHGKPGSPVPISGQGKLPATYQFKTREGNRGVLQILEFIDDSAVKIRYKLLDATAVSHSTEIRPTETKQRVAKPSNAKAFQSSPDQKYLDKHRKLVQKLSGQHGYRLEAGQLMKHIGEPFSETREEFRRLEQDHNSWSNHPENEPLRPNVDFYHWTAAKGTRWVGGTYQKATLASVFDAVLNLKAYQVECDDDLLGTAFPGDWVLPWVWSPQQVRVPTHEDIAALEKILNKKFPQKVSLEWKQVEQTVIVAEGSYKFSPIAGPNGKMQVIDGEMAERAHGYFHFPIRRTRVRSMATGHYPKFLQVLGEVIGLPVVDETEIQPGKNITLFWAFPDGGHLFIPGTKPLDDMEEKQVLEKIAQQTGLRFTRDIRPVFKLYVKKRP